MTREEAIEELKAIKSAYSDKNFHTARLMRSEHAALDMAIKALEQEPSGDLISRDMALEKMADYVASGYADSAEDFEEYSRIICQLPSVNPQEPKTGHWIDCSNGWMCSECRRDNTYDTAFCPHCGAKMVEPQESEDKG